MSPVGAIFVPFPPKTGTNTLHPRHPQSLDWSLVGAAWRDAWRHELGSGLCPRKNLFEGNLGSSKADSLARAPPLMDHRFSEDFQSALEYNGQVSHREHRLCVEQP